MGCSTAYIVTAVDPRLGETVLDPAAGTGGFLVEAFDHLKKQAKKAEDFTRLQKGTFHGVEPKPLPYLLCQMNLLLHGVEYPEIDPLNALRFRLREIGDKDRVDVIMTNPPFGGEEERGILSNFPEDKQTAETALLFLQLIMRKLRRPVEGSKGGRCGMVVPNGVLFGDGICARIKEELLKEFNLHTIVRLPNGVFAPYTGIPTNLLFFDRSGPTKEIWYYEQPLPQGRKNYTKTAPIQFEEFGACLSWWQKREENERAWKVKAKDLLKYDTDGNLLSVNLDIKNRRGKEDNHASSTRATGREHLAERTANRGSRHENQRTASGTRRMKAQYPKVSLGELLRLERRPVKVRADEQYQEIGIYCFAWNFSQDPAHGY